MIKKKLLITGLIGWCSILGMANAASIINCNFKSGRKNEVDPNLCTHLRYPITFSTTQYGDFVATHNGNITQIGELKDENPKLKVFAGIKIEEISSDIHLEMAVNSMTRQSFINTAFSFITAYRFNGLDFFWPLTYFNKDSLIDKTNFVIILEELRAKLEPDNLELSISISGLADWNHAYYDVPNIVEQVNFINVMAYDFAKGVSGLAYDAPLRGPGKRNVVAAVSFWLNQGIPPSKLVLGLSFKGHYVHLADPENYKVGSALDSYKGSVPYHQICHYNRKFGSYWDRDYDTAYIHDGKNFLYYDSGTSILLKVYFANCLNLSGVFISHPTNDDIRGLCGEKYPLLRSINRNIDFFPGDDYCKENNFVKEEIGC